MVGLFLEDVTGLVRPDARAYYGFCEAWPSWGSSMAWLVDSTLHHFSDNDDLCGYVVSAFGVS